MMPDDWLVASRESTGPDVDARTRLMGRLAALGPPEEAVVAKRRIWPWVVATATLAAAVFVLWKSPESQRLVDESAEAEQASDQASVSGTDGVALPKSPSTTSTPVQAREVRAAQAPTVPEPAGTASPDSSARTAKQQSTPAKPRKRARPHAPEAGLPAASASETSDTLAAEAALIGRARAALSRGDASKALKRLREYDDRFESPSLGEEAAALRAMTRCALEGPDGEAAAAFGREFSQSMFRERVRRACAVDGGAE